MRFGAIDIGSNAVRLLIADVHEYKGELRISKLSLTRVPIRLGASVFETSSISNTKTKKLMKTMLAFRYLLDVYDVKDFRACATSAMREAKNRQEVIDKVRDFAGVDIELIDGRTEANLIFSTFITQKLDSHNTYLYVDVGGGSTEITLLKDGKRIKSRSFKIGTVRLMKGKVKEKLWSDMHSYINSVTKDEKDIVAIGTGGNINRLFKMSKLNYGEYLTYDKLREKSAELNMLSFKERVEKLRLRPDRADVIIPASRIYLNVLKAGNIKNMLVPKIGLSDGIALYLYRKQLRAQKAEVSEK